MMGAEKEYAIEVKNLKIRYRTFNKVSLRGGLKGLFKNRVEVFEAVKGVSFKVQKGKIVGLVGTNGSGKSTTLKAIAGIFSPDEGSIDLHGNSVSLLSIGVGFKKRLTGRENIFISGLLMGFTEKQIKEHEQEIIDFSELGRFIDKPVETYSSGMKSKLAFSISAVLETDIILIDEVFSVGDARFKKKSFRKMKELIENENRTVIIVSHSNGQIKRLCDQVIWIHEGKFVMKAKTKRVMGIYKRFMDGELTIEEAKKRYRQLKRQDKKRRAEKRAAAELAKKQSEELEKKISSLVTSGEDAFRKT